MILIEMLDLVGREPDQEREDGGSSLCVERYQDVCADFRIFDLGDPVLLYAIIRAFGI